MQTMMAARHVDEAPSLQGLASFLHRRPTPPPRDNRPRDERPRDPAALLPDVMDLLGDGVILADAAGRVLYMNRTAEAMVAEGLLSLRGGLLGASAPGETQALQALLASCVRGREESAHMQAGGRLFLTVTAVEAAGREAGTRTAVIFLRDVDRTNSPSPRSIIAFFGLTPAEARLAHEITRGDGLARCARRLGTRVTTVRSHLKHIFEKTETKRQAHLVRLLLSCGSSLAAPAPGPRQTGRCRGLADR